VPNKIQIPVILPLEKGDFQFPALKTPTMAHILLLNAGISRLASDLSIPPLEKGDQGGFGCAVGRNSGALTNFSAKMQSNKTLWRYKSR
jgi:hypothetical protein